MLIHKQDKTMICQACFVIFFCNLNGMRCVIATPPYIDTYINFRKVSHQNATFGGSNPVDSQHTFLTCYGAYGCGFGSSSSSIGRCMCSLRSQMMVVNSPPLLSFLAWDSLLPLLAAWIRKSIHTCKSTDNESCL